MPISCEVVLSGISGVGKGESGSSWGAQMGSQMFSSGKLELAGNQLKSRLLYILEL